MLTCISPSKMDGGIDGTDFQVYITAQYMLYGGDMSLVMTSRSNI